MLIRRCSAADLEKLIRIGRETYHAAFHEMNTPEIMTAYLDKAFSREKIGSELADSGSRFYFCCKDSDAGEPAAYFKINFPLSQTDLNDKETLELERIYVRPGFQGAGLGRMIIENVEAIALDYGLSAVWLGVWKKNISAVAFYRKMGYAVTGEHSFLMGDELQSDFIMTKRLR